MARKTIDFYDCEFQWLQQQMLNEQMFNANQNSAMQALGMLGMQAGPGLQNCSNPYANEQRKQQSPLPEQSNAALLLLLEE